MNVLLCSSTASSRQSWKGKGPSSRLLCSSAPPRLPSPPRSGTHCLAEFGADQARSQAVDADIAGGQLSGQVLGEAQQSCFGDVVGAQALLEKSRRGFSSMAKCMLCKQEESKVSPLNLLLKVLK